MVEFVVGLVVGFFLSYFIYLSQEKQKKKKMEEATAKFMEVAETFEKAMKDMQAEQSLEKTVLFFGRDQCRD